MAFVIAFVIDSFCYCISAYKPCFQYSIIWETVHVSAYVYGTLLQLRDDYLSNTNFKKYQLIYICIGVIFLG